VEHLARCVAALGDPESRRDKGRKGQTAVQRRYNWACDGRVLIETIERVKDAGAAPFFRANTSFAGDMPTR
jgi:hypothetical protein